MEKWIDKIGNDEDIVVSTRIRLARNIRKYKFPDLISLDESLELSEDIEKVMKEIKTKSKYEFYPIENLDILDKNIFVEDHLISPNLAKKTKGSSFFVREDGIVSIMVNEEDHIRIQTILPGMDLEKAWEIASFLDDYLDRNLEYAYDEKYGYLTSCPTNVGTGLRASVMLHLPCLTMNGHINNVIEGISKLGLTARGLYGEGSQISGYLFQISNQTTFGEMEEDIVKKLKKVVLQIISRERSTRMYMVERNRNELEDKIFRSFGILKYSRMINSHEAMNHLSNIKLGADLDLIKNITSKEVIKLMIQSQPANLQKEFGSFMSEKERDIYRAEIIREKLTSMEG